MSNSIIKSKDFWLSAILVAIVPLLAIDIVHHYLDWQKEVREELIVVVQNLYSFDRQQKATILDKVFERNRTLTFLFYVKSASIILLLVLGFYFFKRYWKQQRPKLFKPSLYTITLIVCFTLTKIFIINRINTNENIKERNAFNISIPRIERTPEIRYKIPSILLWLSSCCIGEGFKVNHAV